MWPKCADANFHMTFVAFVSVHKYVAPPLFILHGKWLNMGVLEGCYIEGTSITTSPNLFINSNLFLIWLGYFLNCVPDSVARPLVLVYYGCARNYNDDIAKKWLSLKSYWSYCQLTTPI